MFSLNKAHIFRFFIFLFSFFLFSCVTVPASKPENIPDWILHIPQGDLQNEYFTASGTNENVTLAEGDAKNNLILEVVRLLGVSIKTNTSAVSFGDIDTVDKTIEQEIKQYASANIKNLKIKNRYIEKKEGSVTVYLLAAYNKTELQKERERLLALADERADSINRPIKDAERFCAEEKYFAAAYNYVQAGCAVFTVQAENKEIKFENNIRNAKQNLKKIKLNALSGNPIIGAAGKSLPAFAIQCFEQNIPLTVTYSIKPFAANGRQRLFVERVEADRDGSAEFILPLQDRACSGTVRFELDIEQLCKMLKSVKLPTAEKEISELKRITSKAAVVFHYTIEQNENKKNERIGKVDIFIEQYGHNKKALITSETEKNIAGFLQKMNFNTGKINSKKSLADFFIYAKVSTGEVEISDSGFFAVLTAEVEIYDVKANEIIYMQSVTKRGAGFTEDEALISATQALAKQIVFVFDEKIK